MRLLAILLVVSIVGCATRPPYQPQAASYADLERVKVDDVDCPRIDNIIDTMNTQLKLKGLIGKNPEDLTEEDLKYNSRAKVVIWSLRIGCNNPDRYK
jgi:hypothetical protein